MMIGIKIEGRRRLRRMLVRGSKREYETKKMVSVALYLPVLRPRFLERPAILALPMFVRSRKARR
jgi:hypothetical protein